MTDHHDDIDTWLERDVTPLYPVPGSFDRISRVARKRKRRQALLAAACCAVLVAAGATASQLASGLSHGSGHRPPPLAAASSPATTQPGTPTSSGTAGPDANGSKPMQQRQHTTLTSNATSPPPHFRPTSVTVVGGAALGSYVGAVIGQAGPPCATIHCTSLAGTSNYGTSWHGVSAPLASGPNVPDGVSQLRFANVNDGWTFGPGLWETSAGGWPWTKVPTNGLRVTDLEAVGQQAFVIAASCAGDTPNFASDCTSFSVYTLTAGSTVWTPVAVPAGYQHMKTAAPSSSTLVIAGGKTVYALTPSGVVLSGPVSGGAWHAAGPAPPGCLPGPAQANGQPADAQLAAGQAGLLLACHVTSGTTTQTLLYKSADGTSWTEIGPVPQDGTATSLATSQSGQAVLATTVGIFYLAAGGTSWRPASFSNGAAPSGGFSYVGMTSTTNGVAVPANSGLGEIYVTIDGGKTWNASPING